MVMVMTRLRYRCFIIGLISVCLLYFIFQSRRYDELSSSKMQQYAITCPTTELQTVSKDTMNMSNIKRISCMVDGHRTYSCLRDDDDVYFPFEKFLKKQYDVTGKLTKDKGNKEDHFEWSTSTSRVRFPDEGEYDPVGTFGHFASYSVESRDRVRCISAQYGVPLSTQWSSKPYFYPIQIAQYALQHYSRNRTGPEPVEIELGKAPSDWIVEDSASYEAKEGIEGIRVVLDETLHKNVMEIFPVGNDNGKDTAVRLSLNENVNLDVISFRWRSDAYASFTIAAEIVPLKKKIYLHYVHKSDGRCVWREANGQQEHFYYELGAKPDPSSWRLICRDVLTDAGRALASTVSNGKKTGSTSAAAQLHPGDIRVISLVLRGHSWLHSLKQRSSAHMEQFLVVADWFLSNQDDDGGWSVPVERSIAEKSLVLEAGWHSAMAQGHALSVLTRAYAITKELKYLRAAVKGTKLFKINAGEGGVRNDLFGYAWYEEYPTQPGTFVLNGFMYSLIGLYDLSAALKNQRQMENDAEVLFADGIRSLQTFLPLFDTGSGSVYDLRHIGLKRAPNLARWDYHSVHIYLLKWLFQITKQKQLNETANRWVDYTHGKRAKHN